MSLLGWERIGKKYYNEKLILESNGSRGKMTPAGWRSFFGLFIQSNCSLEVLNVSCNGIGDEIVVLINALATFPSLRTLNMGGNQYTAAATQQ